MKIHLRKWPLCPLLDIGRHTLWLTKAIAFGKEYNPASITYFIGWLIMSRKTEYHEDFVERIGNGTWPKGWLWVVKRGK